MAAEIEQQRRRLMEQEEVERPRSPFSSHWPQKLVLEHELMELVSPSTSPPPLPSSPPLLSFSLILLLPCSDCPAGQEGADESHPGDQQAGGGRGFSRVSIVQGEAGATAKNGGGIEDDKAGEGEGRRRRREVVVVVEEEEVKGGGSGCTHSSRADQVDGGESLLLVRSCSSR
eukprot:767994-Hanusia_phi.AAC.6